MIRDELIGCGMHEIHSSAVISKPPEPKARRSLRSEAMEENCSLNNISSNNNFQNLEKKTSRRNTSNLPEDEELSKDQSISYETQMTESFSESEKDEQFQNRSKTISPERDVCLKLKPENHTNSVKNTSSYFYYIILIIIVVLGILSISNENKVQTQSISNPILLLSESIKNVKATFHNQESYIWNDISSAINEVISRTPKIPSIILLFAKETTTMNCLATKLALTSSTILHADSYLVFRPEDFGNDAGEIITILNEHPPEKKKVVVIHDILNINAEAIKALHNLCDRINPLVAEAIYILTMQTNSYQSQQKKLNFVENQIYNKLSKSIDQDVLMALVTRITDGAIISVQPEPQLRYC